ncbi:MAG: SLBB domain-containing protein [Methylacidiphilales bacterium]|nr:SLBB domain-containing protein [Candidatus Methylacidiphilales bacterium]
MSTIKGDMWRKGMSRHPAQTMGLQVCKVLAAFYLLLMLCGSIHAQTETPTPLQATVPAAHDEAIPTDTASSTYRLQPYDLIDVDVYSEEDLHRPARLGSDGTILLPLIGSVQVGGLTVAEATDLITKRYAAGFVKNPSVLITVLQYRKSTFSILGQVLKPGIYEIPEGAHVSILEAVSLAGGYTLTAAQNSITVKRTVDGKDAMFKVNAADMAQDPNAQPFEVLPGDTILVPASQYHRSDFSILGQVTKPGLYQIPDGAHVTIIDAISLAGGCTVMAAQNSITVKRMVKGNLTILTVRASDMAQDPNIVPFEVLPGDSILVPYRNSTFSVLGQVEKPGIYEIPEGAHLNIIEAILMAGGFTHTAAQNSVTVKRMVNGKPTTLKVRAGDMAQKPDLVPFEVLPGDIVKVNESWF